MEMGTETSKEKQPKERKEFLPEGTPHAFSVMSVATRMLRDAEQLPNDLRQ